MPIVDRAETWRRARPWLSAVSAMALLLAALAGPVFARGYGDIGRVEVADHGRGSRLRDAAVSPRSARAGTAIHFAVTWRGATGAPPKTVRVAIDGRRRTMAVSARRVPGGIRFTLTAILGVGRHGVRFEAIGPSGRVVTLPAGRVVIARKRTEPSNGPGAGGGSTGGNGPTVGPTAHPVGSGTAGIPSGSDDAAPVPGGVAEDHDTPADRGSAGDRVPPGAVSSAGTDGDGGAVDGAQGSPGARPAGRDLPAADPTTPPVEAIGSVERPTRDDGATRSTSGHPGRGGAGPGGDSGAGGDSALVGLGLLGPADDPFDRAFRAYPVLISTGGSATIWAAFIIFGKKRRDGELPAPDPVLALQAATGPEAIPMASLVPPPADERSVPPGVDPTEAGLPRWRRPSLLLARKADPGRTASMAVSLTFAEATVPALDGEERRRIRYRLVRLLDLPDEVRATELGILDAGDEVQILDTYGTYRLVVCPDGQQGWLHKMVLGDLVEASDDDPPDGIDEDVLAAFLTTRQKTA